VTCDTRRRWKSHIKMDLEVSVCEGVDWIELAQGRMRDPVAGS
jgi:hypothetical protein